MLDGARIFLKNVWFRARGAHLLEASMVSSKRGTHFLKQYGVVQEGHTFPEKAWFRGNVGSNVGSNIRSNVGSNVGSTVGYNIGSNGGSNVGYNVGSNIRSNVGSNFESKILSDLICRGVVGKSCICKWPGAFV